MNNHLQTQTGHLLDRAANPGTAALMDFGERSHDKYRLLGKGPLLKESVYAGNCWLVPAEQERAPIPPRAQQRVAAIYQAGLRPAGFILAHEAPRTLPAPLVEPKPQPPKAAVAWRPALAQALSWLLIGTVGALALAVDPVLIAVTEEGYWVEIDRWMS
jgi:hypothetical protein